MNKRLILDTFCGAGGMTKGFQDAGFEVIGIDHKSQPSYCGEDFIQGNVMELLPTLLAGEPIRSERGVWLLTDFCAVHASPPCQSYTVYQNTGAVGDHHQDLVAWMRLFLDQTGLPFVIENVKRAPLAADAVLICGSMFEPPMDVRRHRLFETNWPLSPPGQCRHKHPLLKPNRFPGGRSHERTGDNRGLVRATVEVGAWDIPLEIQQKAMGIDWMQMKELTEAIPPVYAEHIGRELSEHLDAIQEEH